MWTQREIHFTVVPAVKCFVEVKAGDQRLVGRAVVFTEVQHTSAYVSIRQHTSASCRSFHLGSAYVSIRQHTSAYVSIRQHTSASLDVP